MIASQPDIAQGFATRTAIEMWVEPQGVVATVVSISIFSICGKAAEFAARARANCNLRRRPATRPGSCDGR